MPATAMLDDFDEKACAAARRLVKLRAHHAGISELAARADIARENLLSPGTIENLIRGRVKDVAGRLAVRVHAALARQLEASREAIEQEIRTRVENGLAPREDVVRKAEALRDVATQLIEEAKSHDA